MEDFVEPAYGRRSLGDVVPAVAAALGVPIGRPPSGIKLPGAASYVILLIDGLGATLLERHAHHAPYLAELLAAQEVGTAGVPTTTVTSLTSLGTGLAPGAHGLVGFSARVPGTDRLLNHLWWDDAVDPLEWQPHPTAFTQLSDFGAQVTVVNKREFRGSGLTVASCRGADFVGADRVGERIAATVTASSVPGSLTYCYDSDLDWTGHKFGVASTQWLQQLAMVDAEAEQLREALPADRRLVVVADHGMVDCLDGDRLDMDQHPELNEGLVLVGGEARFRHLYCRGGAVDDVLAAWREHLDGRADVLTRAEAVGRGWFGTVDPSVAPRIGDIVVAGRGGLGVFSSERFGYETSLIGLHGSLTADEMLIPILLD